MAMRKARWRAVRVGPQGWGGGCAVLLLCHVSVGAQRRQTPGSDGWSKHRARGSAGNWQLLAEGPPCTMDEKLRRARLLLAGSSCATSERANKRRCPAACLSAVRRAHGAGLWEARPWCFFRFSGGWRGLWETPLPALGPDLWEARPCSHRRVSGRPGGRYLVVYPNSESPTRTLSETQ